MKLVWQLGNSSNFTEQVFKLANAHEKTDGMCYILIIHWSIHFVPDKILWVYYVFSYEESSFAITYSFIGIRITFFQFSMLEIVLFCNRCV